MPFGLFKSMGNSFPNQGPQPMNPNPMGQNLMPPQNPNPMGYNPMESGRGFQQQNLFRQILKSSPVQNRVPNIMRGLQRFPAPGQGGMGPAQPFNQGQPPMFGPGGNPQGFGQGGAMPYGRGAYQNPGMNIPGNMPPGTGVNFNNTLDVQSQMQTPQAQPAPQPAKPSSGPSRWMGVVQNLLGRLGIGK